MQELSDKQQSAIMRKVIVTTMKYPSVYAIGNLDHGYVKIGCTTNIVKRLETVRTFVPWAVEVLAIVPGNRIDEARTHEAWKKYHAYGEWFYASRELVSALSALRLRFADRWSRIVAGGLSSVSAETDDSIVYVETGDALSRLCTGQTGKVRIFGNRVVYLTTIERKCVTGVFMAKNDDRPAVSFKFS